MADGKKIEIRIAATGGDQAAEEIRKVGAAAAEAQQASASQGFGGMLDGTKKRNEAHEERLSQIKEEEAALKRLEVEAEAANAAEIRAMKEKEEAAAQYAEKLEAQTREKQQSSGFKIPGIGRNAEVAMGMAGIAAAGAAAAKTLGQVMEGLESINTADLKKIDAAMADQIEQAKFWATALEDPIGALLKLTTGDTVGEAFAAMNEQIGLTARQMEGAFDRIIEGWERQRDEIKKITSEIQSANKILDARDAADVKQRDREDAELVRAGADPLEVERSRAKWNEKREIDSIDRGLDPHISEVNAKADRVVNARLDMQKLEAEAAKVAAAEAEVARLEEERDQLKKKPKRSTYTLGGLPTEGDPEIEANAKALDEARSNANYARATTPAASPEKMAEAVKRLKDMEDELARLQRELSDSRAMATEQKRGVREETAKTLGGIDYQQAQAKREEERKQAQKALEDQKRNDDLRVRNASVKEASGGVDFAKQGKRGDAAKQAKIADALSGFSEDLKNADTVEEVLTAKQELLKSSGLLGKAMVAALTAMANDQAELISRLQAIETTIKNNQALAAKNRTK